MGEELNLMAELGQKRIGFIGAGNMAQSLIGGLLAQGVDASQLFASDPVEVCRAAVAEKGVTVIDDNSELLSQCDVILLAVKPQVMAQVLTPLAGAVETNKPLLISIAAGITCEAMQNWVGESSAIVRCMPNTPSLLREGATGLFANNHVSSDQKQLAQALLQAVGVAVWVEQESQLDAVTALSGSGPAYFFLMLEYMVQKGVEMGLDADAAKQLAQQTALGASKMSIEADVDLQELRRRVTSPNGTTEAAINTFIDQDFSSVVDKSLQAAFDRSQELAQELS